MRNEFTAVIERDDDWYIAFSPEVPGANGQGRTPDEAKTSLAEAIALILEVRREDGLRDLAADVELAGWPARSAARLKSPRSGAERA